MAKQRRLEQPPLREAVFDFRLAQELPSSFIDKVSTRKPKRFEKVLKLYRSNLSLQFGDGKLVTPEAATNTSEQYGWRYNTNDGSEVVQFRRDGITYSVLKGYAGWAVAKPIMKELWNEFSECAGPTEVSRVAVRYINVIEVPTGEDLDLYFTAAPKVPGELPQKIAGFLSRVQIPFSADGSFSAIITQALEPQVGAKVPVVLDIDVFRVGKFPGESAEIWTLLDGLREVKNQIFFSSVSDRALEPHE